MNSQQRHGLFDRYVPMDSLRRIVRCIRQAYAEEHRETWARFDKEFAPTVLPHNRRAQIDQALIALGKRPGETMTVACAPNERMNCKHARMQFGPVVLTQSCVRCETDVVRPAVFRQNYAQDCQGDLFDTDRSPVVVGDLYGILLHRPNRLTPKIPDMFVVQFPNADCTGYLGDSIDVLQRFPDIATDLCRELEEIIKRPKLGTTSVPVIKPA